MDGERADSTIKSGIRKRKGVCTGLYPGDGVGLFPCLREHDVGDICGGPCPTQAAEGNGVVARPACQVEVGARGSQAYFTRKILCNTWVGETCFRIGAADEVVKRWNLTPNVEAKQPPACGLSGLSDQLCAPFAR